MQSNTPATSTQALTSEMTQSTLTLREGESLSIGAVLLKLGKFKDGPTLQISGVGLPTNRRLWEGRKIPLPKGSVTVQEFPVDGKKRVKLMFEHPEDVIPRIPRLTRTERRFA